MTAAVMDGLLAEFGAMIGIAKLEPDAEHRCNMMFDDVAVSFELGTDEETLYIYSLLGTVAETDRAAAFADLLAANYVFQGTRGATLSVDPRSGGIVLVRAERLEALQLSRFAAVVEEFVDAAEQWTARIRDRAFAAPDDRAGDDARGADAGMVRV